MTSGGDAPGMNAAIRAVVRVGLSKAWEVFGLRHGFKGLLAGDFIPLTSKDVSHVIEQGGTLLGSARCEELKTESGIEQALLQLRKKDIQGLVVVGGNGSQKGAFALSQSAFPVVGIASTIDNDLYGADISIGVDSALNVALEAIDRLKVTASSFGRVFLVEMMGRNCGYLALMAGIAGGAEAIVIPEVEESPDKIAEEIFSAYQRGKNHAILVVAEGASHNADRLSAYFEAQQASLGFELRVTKLGHVQRGGTPSAFDRLLATRLGAEAVECLHREEIGVLVGLRRGRIAHTPLQEAASRGKTLDLTLFPLAQYLAQ